MRRAIWHCFRIIFIFSLFFTLGATRYSQFQIEGVNGPLLKNIQNRLSEVFDEESLTQIPDELLIKETQKAVQPYGYFQSLITIHHGAKKNLRIHILLGPQVHIKSTEIILVGPGAHLPELVKIKQALPIQVGAPFNSQMYEEAKQTLFNAAEQNGFLRANFKTSEVFIDEENNNADIHLIFDTGPQYYFGPVRFQKNTLAPEFLARYIPFHEGETYSTEQVLSFNSQLSASGYFREVNLKPKIGDTRAVPIDIHLEPASRINYSLGVGYGTDTGPRGRAGLHVIPVNQYGHKFNVVAQGSFKENALLAQYIIPGLNPVTDQYNFNASLSNLDYNAGYGNSLLLSAIQRHMKDDFQRTLSINGLYERFDYSLEPKQEKITLFPKGTLTYRQVSDNLFSKNGYNVTLSALGASRALLSEINFAQTSLDAKAAINIDPITTRFYLHTIQGVTAINNIDTLPLSLALLLGGSEDLRAYSFNSIGPGKITSYAGLEIQKETVKKWYAIGFFDVGDVYNPSPANYQYDAGAGLMWVSPIGPIKIAMAQSITPEFNRLEGSKPRLVISMGPDL